MGLFSRKEGGASGGRSRPMISSEAQAAELRARARRRLVGAVALVLAAVVILPMVLNPEPDRVADDIPIRLPDTQTPYNPAVNSPLASQESGAGQPDTGLPAAGDPITGAAPGGVAPPPPLSSASPDPRVVTGQTQTPAPTQAPPSTPAPVATPKPAAPKPEPKPAPAPSSRSDDGERALALLEGREPPAAPKPRPVEKGNFVLQIAAYTARADADGRREKLHAAGVTNAFVQPANIGGKEQFRLRVGPFPSRDAAQAAQARLRTLGYDNGFIAAQ